MTLSPPLPDPVQLAIPLFVALVLLEMVAVRLRGVGAYEWRDAGASLALGLGSTVAGALVAAPVAGVAAFAYQFRLFDIPFAWWAFLLAFVADDLAYYWFHRTAHRVRWFWASHVVHHSSQHYNLTTALRQTWTGFVSLSFLFRLPLFLLGFPPEMVVFVAGLNLVYQFFIHTEQVGRLPRLVEAVLNTPSHHRVHHATNPRYLDRNFGGVFIVWDRLFGTFEPERADDRPRYGIIRNLPTLNPLWAAVHEWVALVRDLARARTPGAALGLAFGPPGWKPDDRSLTADAIRAAFVREQAQA
ncbi:sterol desaturase family protein [Thermaurantiacus tibetensis]|uniref:sterol desaturase family protein n=1 Tax=Thermaurantiacus tibetensis TaxID=2759035 RepID=UPI00188ECDC3|nr:sterol desaturase family protein [Thermaurantiacus tibetensis]